MQFTTITATFSIRVHKIVYFLYFLEVQLYYVQGMSITYRLTPSHTHNETFSFVKVFFPLFLDRLA